VLRTRSTFVDVPRFSLDVPRFSLDVPGFSLDVPGFSFDVPAPHSTFGETQGDQRRC
jgi:hypothetical protein